MPCWCDFHIKIAWQTICQAIFLPKTRGESCLIEGNKNFHQGKALFPHFCGISARQKSQAKLSLWR
jgi:hypothetical protein